MQKLILSSFVFRALALHYQPITQSLTTYVADGSAPPLFQGGEKRKHLQFISSLQ